MLFKRVLLGIFVCSGSCSVGNPSSLYATQLNEKAELLFNYNPSIELIYRVSEVMVTCHGYGANKDIGQFVAKQVTLPIITFNFPDHDVSSEDDIHTTSFGTIDEYLPLLYLLKELIGKGVSTIHLYGFSAGGGAVIAALSILNTPSYKDTLQRIGIAQEDARAILDAVSRGTVILDAPLKSVTELLAFRPYEEMLKVLASRYITNGFQAIDCIEGLKGLTLSCLVYFEEPDDVLSNRDDALFYRKLKAVNKGTTQLVTGCDGGHTGFHKKLWDAYKALEKERIAKKL